MAGLEGRFGSGSQASHSHRPGYIPASGSTPEWVFEFYNGVGSVLLNRWSARGAYQRCGCVKLGDSPAKIIESTKVLMATPQGCRLGYRTPEQVSNPEPLDSRICVLTTTLGGGVMVTTKFSRGRRCRSASRKYDWVGHRDLTRTWWGRAPAAWKVPCSLVPTRSPATGSPAAGARAVSKWQSHQT